MARETGREGMGWVEDGLEGRGAWTLIGEVTTASALLPLLRSVMPVLVACEASMGGVHAKSASEAPETCRKPLSWNDPSSTPPPCASRSLEMERRVLDRANGFPMGMNEDRRDADGRRAVDGWV